MKYNTWSIRKTILLGSIFFVGTCLLYYLRNGELTGVDIAFKALAAVSFAVTFYFIGPWLERHRPEDWLLGSKQSAGRKRGSHE